MASHTAPAAIPDPPNHPPDTPATTGTPGRPFGSLLAAVDPARRSDDEAHDGGFNLHPTGASDDTLVLPNSGADSPSSDAFHNDSTDPDNPGKNSSKQETGVVRAWLLAGAERWRKGADARNKALDIRKAKAQALQIKRAETVNRSEKIVGGNTASGTNTQAKSDKSTGSSTKSNNAGSGAKGSTGGGRGTGASGNGTSGGAGRSGSGAGGGRGSSGSGGSHGGGTGSGGSGKGHGKTDHAKTPGSAGGGKTPGGGKDGSSGRQGGTGKAGKDNTSTSTGNGSSGGGSGGGAGRGGGKDTSPKTTTTCGDGTGIDMVKGKKPKDPTAKDTSARKDAPKTAPGSPAPAKTPPGGGSGGGSGGGAGTGKTPAAGDKPADPKKNPDTKGGAKTPDKPATPADLKKTPEKTPKTPTRTPPPRVDTQPAREAGYRDGTRIGRAEAKAHAYVDGVRDGRTDIKDAAALEKDRQDKARADRKPTPAPSPAAKPVPPKPTHPPKPTTPPAAKDDPMTKPAPATPIKVTSTSPTHLELGAGADRTTIPRGEVRNLAGHQKRLADRHGNLTRIAERGKTYEAHAADQTKQITRLLEQAKSAKTKGGEKLIAELAKLAEASKLQEDAAREVHKRAVRGADACQAVSANAGTRYGDIYKAAADSADGPAEFNYYRDLGFTHA
jgi:hypothetical protein